MNKVTYQSGPGTRKGLTMTRDEFVQAAIDLYEEMPEEDPVGVDDPEYNSIRWAILIWGVAQSRGRTRALAALETMMFEFSWRSGLMEDPETN